MRIPKIIALEFTHGEIPENMFNPILHYSPESAKETKQIHTECMCHSTDESDFYPNSKKCKYCRSQHAIAVRKGEITPTKRRK